MDTSSQSPFVRCALASGLLTQDVVDATLAALRWSDGSGAGHGGPPTDRQIADKLVELGRLNSWQAQQLLDGRTKFNLGNYWMIDWIGQGGMGQVFKAEDRVNHLIVAVKVLPRSKSTPEAVGYFAREIKAFERLDHPNLVRALDHGHDGAVHYLVTEYVPGTDLRKLVRRHGPLGMTSAASIISQVALGLEHAHTQGLIHRDVKPGNVLVTPEGHAKLSDMGLAGSLGGDSSDDPRYGKIVGTADYLSPDHIRNPLEPRPTWDIYSLGCTFYYAVTGKVPFPGGTVTDKARAHLELTPFDPRRLNPSLSTEFVDVLADMMAKDPDQRISTAGDVVARLAPWAGVPEPEAASEEIIAKAIRAVRNAKAAEKATGGVPPTIEPPPEIARDTKSSFPEMQPLWPEWRDNSGQVSQSTYRGAVPAGETLATLEGQSVGFFRPLLFFLVIPLGLAGLIALGYWLLRRSF